MVVELRGVEPLSKRSPHKLSTCIAIAWVVGTQQANCQPTLSLAAVFHMQNTAILHTILPLEMIGPEDEGRRTPYRTSWA